MREHYDFSKMKGKKNPYTKYLKQPVTIRLDKDIVSYFKVNIDFSYKIYTINAYIAFIFRSMEGMTCQILIWAIHTKRM